MIRAVLDAQAALGPTVERELIELRRACFSSEDFREGVRAFAEKRPPQWRGECGARGNDLGTVMVLYPAGYASGYPGRLRRHLWERSN